MYTIMTSSARNSAKEEQLELFRVSYRLPTKVCNVQRAELLGELPTMLAIHAPYVSLTVQTNNIGFIQFFRNRRVYIYIYIYISKCPSSLCLPIKGESSVQLYRTDTRNTEHTKNRAQEEQLVIFSCSLLQSPPKFFTTTISRILLTRKPLYTLERGTRNLFIIYLTTISGQTCVPSDPKRSSVSG